MTIEFVGTLGSIVSSLVVVAGVLVAIRQLQHLRASNEVAALNGLIERRSTHWLAVDGPREQSKLERMPPPAGPKSAP